MVLRQLDLPIRRIHRTAGKNKVSRHEPVFGISFQKVNLQLASLASGEGHGGRLGNGCRLVRGSAHTGVYTPLPAIGVNSY